MTGETEAAAEALTGALVAGTIERETGGATAPGAEEAPTPCRNCGARLTGAYCAACGQAAHLHRSLLSLGHDILHSVFHFEGKFWRTMPELMFHPGRLTRRYIEGERVKFISPMALFLFTVFMMFAVFSFSPGMVLSGFEDGIPGVSDFQAGNRTAMETTRQKMDDLRIQLEDPALSAERRAEIQAQIADLESAREVMEALASADWDRIREIQKAQSGKESAAAAEPSSEDGGFERRLNRGLKELNDNPRLLAYKLKTNGYKFSWALVPLSIPFMWLLFFWRRDIRLYDHAVFVTYSISFMMLLVILASLLGMVGVGSGFLAMSLMIAPPWHMYRQLRGAYALSRFGALVRLFFLFIATTVVLTLFFTLLLVIGVLD